MQTMKKLYTYLLAAVALFGVASCSDTPGDDIDPNTRGEEVNVTLRINAADSQAETRAGSRADAKGNTRAFAEATDGELMKSWVIVIAKGTSIEQILQSKYTGTEKEEDEVYAKLEKNTQYTFYAFANITLDELGLNANSTALPTGFADKSATFSVTGNKDSVSEFTNGIPMSGLPVTWTATSNGSLELEVIRMVAKVGIQITNGTEKDMTVQSVSLTGITKDGVATQGNLKLFPSIAQNPSAETDTVAPALVSDADKDFRTYNIPVDKQTIAANSSTAQWNESNDHFVFYVNESVAGVPHYFQLTLTMGDGSTKKYAFLSWKHIARNEYVRIPVVLNDYYIDWQVQGFTAIGVLPSITKSQDKLLIEEPGYGEFHIIPTMYKGGTAAENKIDNWTVGTNAWSLVESDANIFDITPVWNASSQKIDGSIGTTKGYAIYQLAVTVDDNTTIPYKVEIVKK